MKKILSSILVLNAAIAPAILAVSCDQKTGKKKTEKTNVNSEELFLKNLEEVKYSWLSEGEFKKIKINSELTPTSAEKLGFVLPANILEHLKLENSQNGEYVVKMSKLEGSKVVKYEFISKNSKSNQKIHIAVEFGEFLTDKMQFFLKKMAPTQSLLTKEQFRQLELPRINIKNINNFYSIHDVSRAIKGIDVIKSQLKLSPLQRLEVHITKKAGKLSMNYSVTYKKSAIEQLHVEKDIVFKTFMPVQVDKIYEKYFRNKPLFVKDYSKNPNGEKIESYDVYDKFYIKEVPERVLVPGTALEDKDWKDMGISPSSKLTELPKRENKDGELGKNGSLKIRKDSNSNYYTLVINYDDGQGQAISYITKLSPYFEEPDFAYMKGYVRAMFESPNYVRDIKKEIPQDENTEWKMNMGYFFDPEGKMVIKTHPLGAKDPVYGLYALSYPSAGAVDFRKKMIGFVVLGNEFKIAWAYFDEDNKKIKLLKTNDSPQNYLKYKTSPATTDFTDEVDSFETIEFQ